MTAKKRRRKSSSTIVYIPAAVLLIVLLGISGTSVFLRIIDIEVAGASRYSEADIIKASGITGGDSLMFLNAGTVSSRISADMPYIKEVTVEVDIPDKVRISVSETSALASVAGSDGVNLIDSSGKTLEKRAEAPRGLIEIRGLDITGAKVGGRLTVSPENETKLSYMCDVLAAIEAQGIKADVEYLDVSNLAYTSFGYAGKFTIILGKPTDLAYKLSSMQRHTAELSVQQPDEESWTGTAEENGKWTFTPNR